MSRAALIEVEARRRVVEGGFDPDMRADRLSSFDGAGDEPIWRVYAHTIENEIRRLEEAGFFILPARDEMLPALFKSILMRLGRLMGMG